MLRIDNLPRPRTIELPTGGLALWLRTGRRGGNHCSIVAPVRESDLSEDERLSASDNTDMRLP